MNQIFCIAVQVIPPPLEKRGKGGFSDEFTKKQLPVYFIGYVFIKDDTNTKDIKTIRWNDRELNLEDIVSEIFVGGDRKYGWGRLVLKDYREIQESDKFFGHEFKLTTGNPEVTVELNKPIPAHIPVNYALKLKGDIEPLVGREWGIKGAGQEIKLRDEKIYWMPGSLLQLGKTLQIGPYGILK